MQFLRKIFLLTSISVVFLHSLAQNKPVYNTDNNFWVDSVLSSLSDEEKIGQLFMVIAYSNKDDNHKRDITKLITKYNIGGLMFLQGGPVRQSKLTNYYQSKSKVPLMIAIDAEWGVAMRLDSAHSFPWQMTLGAIQQPELIYQMGKEVARQCKLLGIHMNFAPVVDVNSNPKNPIINNRSFGEDPLKVTRMSNAYMYGMQDHNILACAKHFPGHGDTDSDSHKTLPVVNHSKSRLSNVDLLPFNELIKNGLASVMVAHLNVPALENNSNLPTSLSPRVIKDLLQDKLGFQGLVITDGLNMKGVTNSYEPGIVDVKALLAGNDILLCSENVPRAINEIKNAIKNKEITQEEIDFRCRKILMAKKWVGLDNYMPIDLSNVNNITTKNTYLIDKELVKSSLTLLQNYEDLIPLKRLDTLRIASLTIGESDNNVFQDMLINYADVDCMNINNNASLSEQALLLNKLARYNLVIVSIHQSNKNPWTSYKIDKNTDVLLQSIALQNKIVFANFSNPYSLNSLIFTNNFDAVLIGYQNSMVAQEQMAKAIFGGQAIMGRLPVSTKHFNINSGLNTNKIRMSYIYPEEADINTSYLYKIDSIVDYAIENKATPGCQVLIAKDGDIFFNKSYGYHTYDKKIKVKNTDVYDLASITKIAGSLPVLMKMVDDNKIDLDKKIGYYLNLENTNKDDLIIRDILAHQARLQPWIPFYKNTLVKDSLSGLMQLRDTLYDIKESKKFPYKVAEGIFLHYTYYDSIIQNIYLSNLLEEKDYCYSDLGYYLLKEMIEDIYDTSLNIVVEKEFYQKLGMENLTYLPLSFLDKRRIIPTELDFEFRSQLLKGYVHDMGAAMQGGVGGHAGLFSNANDLAKIMQMYLQKGEYAGERYLSPEVIEEFVKCQYCDDGNRRGAGFDKPALENQEGGPTCKCVSHLSFGHSGFTGTLAWVDPSTNMLYIFLSNRIHPDANNKKLLDMNIRTEIMQVIFDSVNE